MLNASRALAKCTLNSPVRSACSKTSLMNLFICSPIIKSLVPVKKSMRIELDEDPLRLFFYAYPGAAPALQTIHSSADSSAQVRHLQPLGMGQPRTRRVQSKTSGPVKIIGRVNLIANSQTSSGTMWPRFREFMTALIDRIDAGHLGLKGH